MPEDQDTSPQPPPPTAKTLSRRQFLRSAGVVGAATALAPALLQPGEGAAEARDDSHAAMQRGPITLTLRVNGQNRTAQVEPRTTLLNTLRNHLDPPLTGTKIVCDRGACGACTVQIDGKTAYSCMVLAADAVGKDIVTVEGLEKKDGTLHPVQAAFVEHDALMCGFCTPGFVMSVQNSLKKNPNPTLEEVKLACAGNTCRCGTYPKVFEAALAAARQSRGKEA